MSIIVHVVGKILNVLFLVLKSRIAPNAKALMYVNKCQFADSWLKERAGKLLADRQVRQDASDAQPQAAQHAATDGVSYEIRK